MSCDDRCSGVLDEDIEGSLRGVIASGVHGVAGDGGSAQDEGAAGSGQAGSGARAVHGITGGRAGIVDYGACGTGSFSRLWAMSCDDRCSGVLDEDIEGSLRGVIASGVHGVAGDGGSAKDEG